MDIIEIEAKNPKIGLLMFIIGFILIIPGILAIRQSISGSSHPVDDIMAGILFLLAVFVLFFFGYYLEWTYRNLKLIDRGFQYIFKDKLKEELLWYEINKIEIKKAFIGSHHKIFIDGPGKRYIAHYFPGTDVNVKNTKSMLREARKQQQQYRFIIDTDI